MNKKDTKVLKSMEPCVEGIKFAISCKGFQEVWDTCERSDWMTWLLKSINFKGDKKLRLYACKVIRETPL